MSNNGIPWSKASVEASEHGVIVTWFCCGGLEPIRYVLQFFIANDTVLPGSKCPYTYVNYQVITMTLISIRMLKDVVSNNKV